MPHVTFVPMTGFRVREQEMLELGMTLPGLNARSIAIGELPALGVLTLAGMTPEPWTSSYRGLRSVSDDSIAAIRSDNPDLVAVSALTASIDEAYELCRRLKDFNIPTVLGGLHATVCPDEAERHADSVVVGRGELVWRDVLADVAQGHLQPRYTASLNQEELSSSEQQRVKGVIKKLSPSVFTKWEYRDWKEPENVTYESTPPTFTDIEDESPVKYP